MKRESRLRAMSGACGAAAVAGEERGVYVYSRDEHSWTRKRDTPAANWTEVYSADDTARKRHVVHSNNPWWTFDAAPGSAPTSPPPARPPD